MNIYLTLFIEFFKTGLFSIGGGLATLPFLFQMSERYSWFTAEQLTNMIAVSESTPGPIGINIATYVGHTVQGVTGAVFATLSLVFPSIIIILIIARFLEKFQENKMVQNVFYGLRAAVVGLILASVLIVFKSTFLNLNAGSFVQMLDLKKAAVYAVLTFLAFKFKKHPILYIALGAAAGVLFAM